MPIARFQMPDGRVARFEVPDGTTPEQAQAIGSGYFSQQPAASETVSAEASRATADDTGMLEAAAVATGRGFDKLAMGAKELALKGVRSFGGGSFAAAADKELTSLAAEEAVKDSAFAGLQQKFPFTTGLGEVAVPVVASGGMAVGPAALTMGGLAALKPGSTQERLGRGAAEAGGAFVGGKIGEAVGSLIAPIGKNAAGEAQREALKIADSIGYKPRLSEITGSPYVARLEDVAARLPGGAGIMDDFARANQQAINRTAARSIGENADELTAPVFARASERIGGVFEQIRALPGKPIAITPKVGAAADEVLRMQNKMIPGARDAELVALANQAKTLASNMGKLDGEAYQLIRSNLSEKSFEASGTNKALYGKLLRALDDAAQDSLRASGNRQLADAFKAARPQYANLKTLEKGATANGGDISAARVASALRANNPAAFREGRMAGNPLYDVAVLGERLRPLLAGSPTFERDVTSSLLDTIIKAPYAWGSAKLTTGAVPRSYAGLLATNDAAGLLAQPVAQIAQPGSRALGGLLAQRFLIPSVPVFAE